MTTSTLTRTPVGDDAARPTAAALDAALAGAVGAAVALGLSELLAGVLPGATSLVAAVGQVVIDVQPAGAKDVVVALFGINDKLALELFVAGVAVAIGAGLGIVARRLFLIATVGFISFGVVGFLASLGDPLASPAIVAASVALAVGVGLQVLTYLLARAMPSAASLQTTAMPDHARRSFLLRAAGLGVGAIAAGTNLAAYNDYVTEDVRTFRGAVTAAAPSFETTYTVAPGAISLDVMIDWQVAAHRALLALDSAASRSEPS